MTLTFPIELAVCDKTPLVLTGLQAVLRDDARFNLVVSASDGERFMTALERIGFDFGVIGWEMPYMGGAEVLTSLRSLPRSPRIVVYSGTADAAAPREAMRLGAAAFVGKSETPARLIEVILAVADGQMVFPFTDLRALWDDPLAHLTPRERALLDALGSGKTNVELARTLDVSVNTIKFHLRNLFEKLGVRSRAQAVELLHRRG